MQKRQFIAVNIMARYLVNRIFLFVINVIKIAVELDYKTIQTVMKKMKIINKDGLLLVELLGAAPLKY